MYHNFNLTVDSGLKVHGGCDAPRAVLSRNTLQKRLGVCNVEMDGETTFEVEIRTREDERALEHFAGTLESRRCDAPDNAAFFAYSQMAVQLGHLP